VDGSYDEEAVTESPAETSIVPAGFKVVETRPPAAVEVAGPAFRTPGAVAARPKLTITWKHDSAPGLLAIAIMLAVIALGGLLSEVGPLFVGATIMTLFFVLGFGPLIFGTTMVVDDEGLRFQQGTRPSLRLLSAEIVRFDIDNKFGLAEHPGGYTVSAITSRGIHQLLSLGSYADARWLTRTLSARLDLDE
jgi:hypothetical protein